MKVNEIVKVLPDGHPFRIETGDLWEIVLLKGEYDDHYNRIMQEYGDYDVVRIESFDNGIYDYATLWLIVENHVEDNPYKISDHTIFEMSRFEYLETYKQYTILKASLNQHNSEYVIKELGFETRWSSLTYCKKYIREQLRRKE